MDQKLYKSLVESIGIAIQKSINEMARLSVQRTIDRKLWLSVASTCSRNKSTDAEFIKPGKEDKDNLLNRYVAALIIMRKPCPQNENDIDDIKTFKLIGQKYLELGGTIEEIQDLYKKNTGKSSSTTTSKSVENPIKTEDKKESNKGFDNAVEQKTTSSGLFDDDDIFGDDEDNYDDMLNSELTQNIVGLNVDTPLSDVLIQQLNTAKPRGWKYIKHTSDTYDKFIYVSNTDPEFTWNYHKYLSDVIKLINTKGWSEYKVKTPGIGLNYVRFENMSESEVKQQIQYACEKHYTNAKNIDNIVNTKFSAYKEYISARQRQINNINNAEVQEMFQDDQNLFQVYLSPDNGLILTCKRPDPIHIGAGEGDNKDYYTNYNLWEFTLTFTGKVNYNNDVRNKNDIKRLKEEEKKFNNRKKAFKKLLKENDLKNFNYTIFKDSDNYPVMVEITTKNNCELTYNEFTKKRYSPYRGTYVLYEPSNQKTYKNSFKECVQNKLKYGHSYLKLVLCKNDGRFGHSPYSGGYDEAYKAIMLTDQGKAKIDSML